MIRGMLVYAVLAATVVCSAFAFSIQNASSTKSPPSSTAHHAVADRRQLLQGMGFALAGAIISPRASSAAMKSDQKIFTAGKSLSEDEALARLKEGRISAQALLDNYDSICENGGDAVRRYLGTVGTSSGLWGISKVLKALSDRADDIVDYTELSNEVEKTIQQADGSAYMAIFVSTSSSSTPPSKYFGDAKIEVKRLITALDEIGTMIGVDYSK